MGESTGREDEVRAGASAVPESVRAVHDGDAGDPSFSDELPVFPARSKSAGTLDLAVATDEPEQLVRYLVMAAQEHIGFSENTEKWKIVLGSPRQSAGRARSTQRPKGSKPCGAPILILLARSRRRWSFGCAIGKNSAYGARGAR